MLFFGIKEIGCDLSLMKISYKLMKRTTKAETCLKMYIIKFKTKSYNLNMIRVTLSIQSSITSLRHLQKQAETAISRKKFSEKSVEGI